MRHYNYYITSISVIVWLKDLINKFASFIHIKLVYTVIKLLLLNYILYIKLKVLILPNLNIKLKLLIIIIKNNIYIIVPVIKLRYKAHNN